MSAGERLLRITEPIPEELRAEEENTKRLTPEAVEDLLVVCEYTLSDA
jgi:hypothetical protein